MRLIDIFIQDFSKNLFGFFFLDFVGFEIFRGTRFRTQATYDERDFNYIFSTALTGRNIRQNLIVYDKKPGMFKMFSNVPISQNFVSII